MPPDGYLVVATASTAGLTILVCPRGYLPTEGQGSQPPCANKDSGSVISPMSPQAALDMVFGKGATTAVGLAPSKIRHLDATVIFYRIMTRSICASTSSRATPRVLIFALFISLALSVIQ